MTNYRPTIDKYSNVRLVNVCHFLQNEKFAYVPPSFLISISTRDNLLQYTKDVEERA